MPCEAPYSLLESHLKYFLTEASKLMPFLRKRFTSPMWCRSLPFGCKRTRFGKGCVIVKSAARSMTCVIWKSLHVPHDRYHVEDRSIPLVLCVFFCHPYSFPLSPLPNILDGPAFVVSAALLFACGSLGAYVCMCVRVSSRGRKDGFACLLILYMRYHLSRSKCREVVPRSVSM